MVTGFSLVQDMNELSHISSFKNFFSCLIEVHIYNVPKLFYMLCELGSRFGFDYKDKDSSHQAKLILCKC